MLGLLLKDVYVFCVQVCVMLQSGEQHANISSTQKCVSGRHVGWRVYVHVHVHVCVHLLLLLVICGVT